MTEMSVPPFTHGAAERVRDIHHLEAVLVAYHRPELRWRASGDQPDREIRRAGSVQVVVAGDHIIGLTDIDRHEMAADAELRSRSRLPNPRPPQRKARGGGAGRRMPTSIAELVDRARRAGADVTMGGRHLRVQLPDWRRPVTIPVTPSDWRSINNAAHELCRKGVNVMRF